ncbi:HEAT repeat domain-containing protein, partial [Candidatus Micrarchaeota archaeon]|nr:HEAT repeat domain-containing protein [Candidatus Micrarchaeota archaeon]
MEAKKPREMPDEVWKYVQDLKYEDWKTSRKGIFAAEVLGERRHESAVPFLIRALKDENGNMRERAAEALGKIKHENAVKPLIQALKDEHWGVRERAAKALGEIKHESAIEPLTQALKDENWGARKKAAEALFKIIESLEEKQEQGKKLTPEGEKLLKAISLVKPHFQPKESEDVKVRVLHAALTGK